MQNAWMLTNLPENMHMFSLYTVNQIVQILLYTPKQTQSMSLYKVWNPDYALRMFQTDKKNNTIFSV